MTIALNDRSTLAVTFPGQGGYDAAALQETYRRHSEVREVFERIDSVTLDAFSRRLTDVLITAPGGTALELPTLLEDEPWVSQLAIYGVGLAAWALLNARGVEPAVLCGHSLGEITALVAAEVFSVEDGARIVARRVLIIDEIEGIDGRMVALAADAERGRALATLLDDPLVAMAAANHDRQTVLSGPARALERMLAVAGAAGISTIELEAPFPFHTPMLQPAVAPFAEYVGRFDQHPMRRAVYSPILNRYYEPDDSLGELLAQHFVLPVDFAGAIRALSESGVRYIVEAGGRATLSKITSRVAGASLETMPTLAMTSGVLALTATVARLTELGHAVAPTGYADPAEAVRIALAAHLPAASFADFWRDERASLASAAAELFARWSDASGDARVVDPPTAAAAAEPGVESAGAASGGAPDRAVLFDEVTAVYAQALEYPADVFGDGALLEADLGVDSVKQIELLSRVSSQFGLAASVDGFALSEVDTLDKVVDFLAAQIAAHYHVVGATGV